MSIEIGQAKKMLASIKGKSGGDDQCLYYMMIVWIVSGNRGIKDDVSVFDPSYWGNGDVICWGGED